MRLLFAVLAAADSFTDELVRIGNRLIERPHVPLTAVATFSYLVGEIGFETMVFTLLLAIYMAVLDPIGDQEADQ